MPRSTDGCPCRPVRLREWAGKMAAAAAQQDIFLGGLDLQRLSTGEQVAQSLREAILSGRLAPGAHLREAVLADAFDVSRNTVRGAIQVLAHDGLVTHRVHRGAFVTEFEPSEVEDIYATRRLLELTALDRTPAANSLLPLEAALAGLREAIDGGGDVEFRDAHLKCHRAIAALHRSPRLLKLFAEMEAETRLATVLLGNVHPDTELVYQRHSRVLELLRAGDLVAARETLGDQLRESEQHLLAELARGRADAAGA